MIQLATFKFKLLQSRLKDVVVAKLQKGVCWCPEFILFTYLFYGKSFTYTQFVIEL